MTEPLTKEMLREAREILDTQQPMPMVIQGVDGLKIRTWNNLRSYKKDEIVMRNGVMLGTAAQDTDWREGDLWIYVRDHRTTQPTDDSSG